MTTTARTDRSGTHAPMRAAIREILLIRQPADKMDAAQIEAPLELVQHVFAPIRGLLRHPAIADAVAADDDRARVRPRFENLGQGAHEDVKAAAGFETARAVGDDLVAR